MRQEIVARATKAMWNYDPFCGLLRWELEEEVARMDAKEIADVLRQMIAEDESGDVEELEAALSEVTAAA